MPKPSFFKNLGLFVQSDFLSVAARSRIEEQILASEPEKATIIEGNDPKQQMLDETVRKVLCAKVQDSTVACMKERLLELKPQLENHFRLSLSGFERSGLLEVSPEGVLQASPR